MKVGVSVSKEPWKIMRAKKATKGKKCKCTQNI